MTLPDLLVLALAAWRLAYLLVREDAPWRVFARLRTRFPLGGLLDCVYCASIWTAAGMMLLWNIGGVGQVFVVVLAISGAGLMLATFSGVAYQEGAR